MAQSTHTPDAQEFASFMRAFQNMVFSTAARMTGEDAVAEDIAQEVFTKAYVHFEQLRDNPAAAGWLKTVTLRLTLNYMSRYRRRWRLFSEVRRNDEADDDVEFAAPETLLQGLDAERRGALVDAALKTLPAHQRTPLVLFHFEELSYEQIAAALNTSLAKVKTDIFRGRAALARKLQRAGLDQSLRDET